MHKPMNVKSELTWLGFLKDICGGKLCSSISYYFYSYCLNGPNITKFLKCLSCLHSYSKLTAIQTTKTVFFL